MKRIFVLFASVYSFNGLGESLPSLDKFQANINQALYADPTWLIEKKDQLEQDPLQIYRDLVVPEQDDSDDAEQFAAIRKEATQRSLAALDKTLGLSRSISNYLQLEFSWDGARSSPPTKRAIPPIRYGLVVTDIQPSSTKTKLWAARYIHWSELLGEADQAQVSYTIAKKTDSPYVHELGGGAILSPQKPKKALKGRLFAHWTGEQDLVPAVELNYGNGLYFLHHYQDKPTHEMSHHFSLNLPTQELVARKAKFEYQASFDLVRDNRQVSTEVVQKTWFGVAQSINTENPAAPIEDWQLFLALEGSARLSARLDTERQEIDHYFLEINRRF